MSDFQKYNENATFCKIDCHFIVNLPDYDNENNYIFKIDCIFIVELKLMLQNF